MSKEDVKIKPLKWFGSESQQRAEIMNFGNFIVRYTADSEGYFGLLSKGYETYLGISKDKTMESAKEECEKHYRKYVLSLLK